MNADVDVLRRVVRLERLMIELIQSYGDVVILQHGVTVVSAVAPLVTSLVA